MSAEKRRCAIYTRTSSEEGLSQDFNSLHAQAEACSAFIRSQTGEGWRETVGVYEDGGYSGGSMERPAIKRLLADIEAKRIDVIVVYKVDRLTRSLADFAKIVEIMDKAEVSFVSVTQSFNTTTSMGRLTLNVLLSFAQFEREVTGERIRDKIAASKAKGLWMGGPPPLGYDVKDRALVVNEAEAETVRFIFRRFLEVGSVHGLMTDLDQRGVVSKKRVSSKGKVTGGKAFGRGALYELLANQTYRGIVAHKGQLHQGQHARIVDEDLWDEVQALRAAMTIKQKERKSSGALLTGKVFDDRGNAMTPGSAHKRAKRYRYYVSSAVTYGRRREAGSLKRIAMTLLDTTVVDAVEKMLAPTWLPELPAAQRALEALQRVEVSARQLALTLRQDALDAEVPAEPGNDRPDGAIKLCLPIALERLRNTMALIRPRGPAAPAHVDRSLVRSVVMAHAWMKRLEQGAPRSIAALAEAENLCVIHTGKLLPLAFLAPDLVQQILEGRQPRTLTITGLLAEPLPLSWAEQRKRFTAFP